MTTRIEWAERTWNPITGCAPISAGCANCYARRFATRLAGMGHYDHDDPFAVRIWANRMEQPYHWRNPARIFVCSMGDLFHQDVPNQVIDMIVNTAEALQRHTWILLTKRPARMAVYFQRRPVPPTMWLGTTIEHQEAANDRLACLTSIQTPRLWVSAEPLLQPISIAQALGLSFDCQPVTAPRVRWVVCGAETGPGRRQFNEQWARYLKDQCVAAGVPFFYKRGPVDGRLVTTPILDGQRWMQYPGFSPVMEAAA